MDAVQHSTENLRRGEILIVAALTAVALALRLLGLGHESIWYDEAYTLNITKAAYLDLLTGRVADAGNPFGYYFLLRGWLDLFGSASIETARAFSAVCGALGVPAVWLLARTLGLSPRVRWLACLLVAVSPPLVYLGQEARVFALFATVATLTLTFVVRIEREDRLSAWIGFSATGIALLYLHYYGFFVLTVLGLYLLAWAWRRSGWTVCKLVAASSAVAVGFAPYLPVFLWQLRQGTGRSEQTWWQHLALLPSFSIVGRTLVWKQHSLILVAGVDLVILATIFVPLAWLLVRSRAWPRPVVAFTLGLPVVVVLVSLTLSPMVSSHYLSVLFPALMLLLACAFDAGLREQRRGVLWLPATALAVFMAVALARVYVIAHKTDWRALAASVERSGPDLPVYFYEDIGGDPFAYYRPGQPRRVLIKPFGAGGAGWESDLDRMRHEREGFWLVLYLTSPRTRSEEADILATVRQEFTVVGDTEFTPMRAVLCRPKESDTRSASAARVQER